MFTPAQKPRGLARITFILGIISGGGRRGQRNKKPPVRDRGVSVFGRLLVAALTRSAVGAAGDAEVQTRMNARLGKAFFKVVESADHLDREPGQGPIADF